MPNSQNMGTLVFSTPSYEALRDRICALCNAQAGHMQRREFPDGEQYQRFMSPVAEQDVILVGGTISAHDTLSLYDMTCGAVALGARSLTLAVPYFGYATMERVAHEGEVVTAKTRAQMFSHIQAASSGSRVLLLDLHAEGIPHYFENGLRPVHLYARGVIVSLAQRLGGQDFVMACTDAGRAKWVESLANQLGMAAAFVFKRRIDDRHTEVAAIDAQVRGKHVIIYDDMIRTGGSLLAAARAYRAAGAVKISALATHGVFPQDALQRLVDARLFDHIACTDSHPRALSLQGPHLEVQSVAGVFADYLNSHPI